MQASEKGDLTSQIELWLKKKRSTGLYCACAVLQIKSWKILATTAPNRWRENWARSYPNISARVYRALCMRIVIAGKSKYYDAALDHIEHAKKCYVKAGCNADWHEVVADVRKRHFRKKEFISGFEDIVAGTSRHVEPPFLERAKTRWPRKVKGR